MNLWLKIKVWTKTTGITLLLFYLLLFIYKNSGSDKKVEFWYWFNTKYEGQLLMLMLITFLAGGLTYFLVRTIFRTIGQVRELQQRKQQREVTEMVKKAAMLRTKPDVDPGVSSPPASEK